MRRLVSLLLMAGLLVTAPLRGGAVAASAAPPLQPDLLRLVRAAVGSDDRDARYVAASIELNSDSRPETLVYVVGPFSCGSGGCPLVIFSPVGRTWRQVGEISIVQLPVRRLDSMHNGWHDIGVTVAGGGISPAYEARLSIGRRSYPANPTVAPAMRSPRGAGGLVLLSDADKLLPLFH